jgi:hypothetical protein
MFVLGIAAICQACSLNVPINDPRVSGSAYDNKGNTSQTQLRFQNSLPSDHQVSTGRIKVNLKNNGSDLDTAKFVATHLERELKARGTAIEFSDAADNTIELQTFEVLNHRVSGFSPMVTISTAKADLKTAGGSQRIASMVKRGKLPVWTMDEINDPCFNEPIELLIKELAAKINAKLTGYSLTDAEVDALVAKIEANSDKDETYFDVYELGFSNNPKAIPKLKEFTSHSSDYLRMAAISSLGMLGSADMLEYLQGIYKNGSLWQDRGMALKAVGDLGTDEALAFLQQEKNRWQAQSSNEALWNVRIIELYVD